MSHSEHDEGELPDDGYGESSRYAAHLDRGWSLLDRGDYAAARKSALHAGELRPEAPDSAVLLGAIALAEGDPEESVEWYLRAVETDADYLEPYAAAAQVYLFDLGDAARALAVCEDALAMETTPIEALDMGLLAAECEVGLRQLDAVRERLDALEDTHELATILDPESDAAQQGAALERLWGDDGIDEEEASESLRKALQLTARLGRLWLDLRLPEQALPWLRGVVRRSEVDADAWYLLGEAETMLGNSRAATQAALRTYRLDAELRLPEWVPRAASIHRLVIEAVTSCSDANIRGLIEVEESLVVVVHEAPSLELVMEGVDPRAPALALAARPAPTTDLDAEPVLTGMAIYRRNLARLCADGDQFAHELRHAVLDELAIFLQLDDKARTRLGLAPLAPPPVEEKAKDEEKPKRRRKRTRMHS